MPDVIVKTRSISRDKLAAFLPSHELVKAFENLTEDVSVTIPAAVDQNNGDAAAAQSTANTALANAATAQATADSLKVPSYLVLGFSASLANERAVAFEALSFAISDGGPGGVFSITSADLRAILAADVTDSSAAFVDATGLVLALVANATYHVEGLITFQSAATTTGIALGFTIPAGATISGRYEHNVSATAVEGSYNIASGAVKGNTSGVLVATENVPISGRWIIKTAATAGNAQMQFRSEVAASAVTLKAGLSALVARRIA